MLCFTEKGNGRGLNEAYQLSGQTVCVGRGVCCGRSMAMHSEIHVSLWLKIQENGSRIEKPEEKKCIKLWLESQVDALYGSKWIICVNQIATMMR